MNAVEIESAISELALQPFDGVEFPYAFLAAFGNKDTALKRLRTGNNNASESRRWPTTKNAARWECTTPACPTSSKC